MKITSAPRETIVKAACDGKVITTVVGLGHVGLPLAVLLASRGVQVIGCDQDRKHVQKINTGQITITEFDTSIFHQEGTKLEQLCDSCGVSLVKMKDETFCPYCGKLFNMTKQGIHRTTVTAQCYSKITESRQDLGNLLKQALESGALRATLNTIDSAKESDVIIITVGSPIDEHNTPNLKDLENASHSIGIGLQKDTLVILKSTVPPGTTQTLVKPVLETESKLKAGKDFQLAYMPETIYEGHALNDLRLMPRIVAGVTIECAKSAANFFSIFPAPVHIYKDLSAVEAAKLFMNIYRDVNIALVNELAMICEKMDVNVIETINAANVEKKTHLLTPGLVGGYCLPKDSYHLIHRAKKAGCKPQLITIARRLNNQMPNHILELIDDAYKEMNIPIKDSTITLLGLGFKPNSGDLRNAPSVEIVKGLHTRGVNTKAHDPYAQPDEVQLLMPDLTLTKDLQEAVEDATCTVIVTDHLEYRNLTPEFLKEKMKTSCAIVDARHLIDPDAAKASRVIFRGLGKPSSPSAGSA